MQKIIRLFENLFSAFSQNKNNVFILPLVSDVQAVTLQYKESIERIKYDFFNLKKNVQS